MIMEKYKWIISNHHIAIEAEDEILHPDAEELFSLITDREYNSLSSPEESFKSIRFSKIGSPVQCELYLDEKNQIILSLYAVRRKRKWQVDMIQGKIIDHAVTDHEWFYLNNDLENLEEVFREAGVTEPGPINTRQYLKLLNGKVFSENSEIINNVNPAALIISTDSGSSFPAGLKANLFEYQKTGYLWLRRAVNLGYGGILGDEMGLGKTLQIISLFQSMKENGELPLLVVAPVSLLENWKRECAKFAPDLDVLVHQGSKRTGFASELKSHDVVVLSYNTVINDLSLLKMISWKCVVLDEAQNIKNPMSKRAGAVKSLNRESGIAVSGTPFENHITDIWSLVDFVMPGLLGTLKQFKETIPDDVTGAVRIEPVLSSIMIRRCVAEVADDLPEKIIIPQPIQMSEQEKFEYEQYRKIIIEALENGNPALGSLQKLRMYCTHPYLCEDGNDNPEIVSLKYQRFLELVEEILSRKEKVIVFTSYRKMFDIIKNDIENRYQISVDAINGDTPVEERQSIVDKFNKMDGSAMLVLNPRAAGTGLNITGANHVIHYNLEWNPSLEDQSSARAYRRGQKKTVFIYRLYYCNTVEEIVNQRIEEKREVASNAVVGTDGKSDKNDILRAINISPFKE